MVDTSKPRIIITERADLDLDEIGDRIAEQSGEERAETLLRKIDEEIRQHAAMPLSGQQRNALRKGLRSFHVYRYVIFYRPLDNGIRIIRILHGSRDLAAQEYDDTGDERILQ